MPRVFDCVDCGIHVRDFCDHAAGEGLTLTFGAKCSECEFIAKQSDPMYRARLRSILRMGLKVAPAT